MSNLLIKSENLSLWLSEDDKQSWNSDLEHKMGRPNLYLDLAVETACFSYHFNK